MDELSKRYSETEEPLQCDSFHETVNWLEDCIPTITKFGVSGGAAPALKLNCSDHGPAPMRFKARSWTKYNSPGSKSVTTHKQSFPR